MTEPTRASHDAAASWVRRLLTAALLAALLSPVVRNQDSLPLSTYPMYAGTRSNLSSFVTAVGLDDVGDQSTLSALTISQSRDRLIAQSFLNDAVQRGEAAEACEDIVSRVAPSLVTVEIAVEQHDTIARLRGDESLQERTVVASCGVPE